MIFKKSPHIGGENLEKKFRMPNIGYLLTDGGCLFNLLNLPFHLSLSVYIFLINDDMKTIFFKL